MPRNPIMRLAPALLMFWLLGSALVLAGCQTAPATRAAAPSGQRFLEQLRPLEGQAFPGVVDESHTPENPFAGEPLVMHVLEAGPERARIALHVGEDRSRTWYLTMEQVRLRLRHDHRYPDGTPHDLTDYGGVAVRGGSPWRQSFPADPQTAALIPEAATNVWTMSHDPDLGVFVYDLTRHGRARFRAVFDLSMPLASPAAPMAAD